MYRYIRIGEATTDWCATRCPALQDGRPLFRLFDAEFEISKLDLGDIAIDETEPVRRAKSFRDWVGQTSQEDGSA